MAIRRFAMAAALALLSACSSEDGECSNCSVVVERVTVLGTADGDGALPGVVRSIVRDQEGRLLIGAWNAEQILIFDTTGKFVEGIGRRGEGPGEFGGAVYILVRTRGDSIVALDAGANRLSSFSATWEPGWTAPDITDYGGGSLIALPDGGFVRSGEVPRRANPARDPLHVLDAEGQLVRSFGADSADPDAPGTMYPTLAVTPDGRIWAVDRHRYRLVLWSTEGKPLRTIERTLEWFPPRTSAAAITPEQPPVPAINAIHVDAENRIWVFIQVPAPEWKAALGEEEQGAHGPRFPVTDYEILYETVIEVLDAASGELVASARVPQRIEMVVEDGMAAAYFEDSLGVPRVELLRLRLNDR